MDCGNIEFVQLQASYTDHGAHVIIYVHTYIRTGLGRLRAAVCTNSLIIIVYSQLVGKLLCCQRQLISW